MKDVAAMRRALAEYLTQNGLEAVPAWGEERRLRAGKAVAAVSLREMKLDTPGFQEYLGQWQDPDSGQWRELYGRQAELTFGVDLCAATAEEVMAGVDALAAALSRDGPEGMRPAGLTVGETVYQTQAKRYFCPAQARFRVWTAETAGEDGAFLDFEVRGENKT